MRKITKQDEQDYLDFMESIEVIDDDGNPVPLPDSFEPETDEDAEGDWDGSPQEIEDEAA